MRRKSTPQNQSTSSPPSSTSTISTISTPKPCLHLPGPRLPFWLRLKAPFRLYLLSLIWRRLNPCLGSQHPFWLRFNFSTCCISDLGSWLCFSKPPSLSSVSAPQVAGPLPAPHTSGRSRLGPFVWDGILPFVFPSRL